MRLSFTEEQQELRAAARRFLDRYSSPERVRRAMQSESGFDPEVWGRAAELGWTALIVPEAYDGLGLGAVELVALLEETGRALWCAPLWSTVCLATQALMLGDNEAPRREHLPAIATGELTATLAHLEPGGAYGADGISAIARRDGDDFVLSGVKTYVIDGHTASLLLVVARVPDTRGARGVGVFAIPGDAPGVDRRALPTLDMTRKQAEIALRDVRVPATARLDHDDGAGGWALVERTFELASLGLAAEQVGGAERCLEMAVDYAKVRTQFGRPIGSFQAIKHKCADMLVVVESARSAVYGAACAAAAGDPELPLLAATAKAYCSDAYFRCAADNIQIHGGIGFTWEHDAHLYFKRARSSAALLGAPSLHRERVAHHIGL